MIFIGDIHGNYHILKNIIENVEGKENFIQVGDFGIGFSSYNDSNDLKVIDEILFNNNSKLYVVRGNHDNPNCFIPNNNFTNIEFVGDYTFRIINDIKVLMIGGGISIDRTQRLLNISYWENEIMVDNLSILPKECRSVDILVTHVPLYGIHQYKLNNKFVEDWCKHDNYLRNDLLQEKELLEKINNEINYSTWISGHLHIYNNEEINNKKYVSLGINEVYDYRG